MASRLLGGDGRLEYDSDTDSLTVKFHQLEDQKLLELIQGKIGGQLNSGLLEVSGEEGVKLLHQLSEYRVCPFRKPQDERVSRKFGIPTTLHAPTIDWFVGFWDADGSSQLYSKSFRISIGQSVEQPLLRIRKLWDLGSIYWFKDQKIFAWVATTASKSRAAVSDVVELLLSKSLSTPKREKLKENWVNYQNTKELLEFGKALV